MYKLLDDKIVYLLDGLVKGEVCFKIKNGEANIYYTYVDDDLRGKGIAGELVKRAFDYIEKSGYKVKCSCSYAKNWGLNHEKL